MGKFAYYSIENSIAVLTLDNPPVNANNLQMTRELGECLAELGANQDVRVVIVTGAGEKAFCAGSDIKEFIQLMDPTVAIDKKMAKENLVFNQLDDLPKPTIAAINGFALGGGAELSLCCDIRVMDETKKIGFPECKLGVFPGSGGTQRLPRIVGEGLAKELMFTGDPITAQRAYEIGLVNRVAPAGQAVAVAMELAGTIAQRSGVALEAIKQVVDYGLVAGFAAGQAMALQLTGKVFGAEDIKEGVAAFTEKREPRFTHR